MANAVVSLDVSVLLGLAGLDVLDENPLFLSPFHQLFIDVFRAVVDPYCAGFAAPLVDTVQTADDPFGWQGKVDLDAQPFAVEIIQNVQQPERPAIAETVCHDVHGPSDVGRLRHR
jgi:hypothetical protein